MKAKPFLLALLLLGGCAALTPPDPAEVDRLSETTAAHIARLCAIHGFIKTPAGQLILLGVSGVAPPAILLDRGVDLVCLNPEHFAHDSATLLWLLENLKP